MTMQDMRGVALARARMAATRLSAYPGTEPATTAEALLVQDAMVSAIGEQVAGWKIGCTSKTAQEALGADGPFFGPVIASRCFNSEATVATAPSALRIVESEVALTMGRTLFPRERDYDVSEVLAAVVSVHPAIELVDRRLPGRLSDGLMWNIADCGVNDALVLGAGTHDFDRLDFAGVNATVRVNNEIRSSGNGASALGGGHLALTWLVNEFSRLGRTLQSGQVVTTGLITEIFTAEPGEWIESDFGVLGKVSVTIA